MKLNRICLFMLFFCCATGYAQRYNFKHYDVSNGVSQSQILAICQDKSKQIWLSNFEGINSFNGRDFRSFTTDDGLGSNSNFAITTDSRGTIWCGGAKGITAFTNHGFVNYPFDVNPIRRGISELVCDKNDRVWFIVNMKLFHIEGKKLVQTDIASAHDYVTSIRSDEDHNLYAFVFNTGIYKLTPGGWQLKARVKNTPAGAFIIDKQHADSFFLIGGNRLYSCINSVIKPVDIKLPENNITEINCATQDHNYNLWLGTNRGAVLLKNGATTYFDERNGFTNERVFCVFNDSDDRTWFGTDGTGLYCFENGSYVIYDKTQGLNNEVVMTVAKGANGGVFLGTYGGGMWNLANNKLSPELLPLPQSKSLRINCLYSDKRHNLWVATDNAGLWKRSLDIPGLPYRQVFYMPHYTGNFFCEDDSDRVWLATSRGCGFVDNGKLNEVPHFNHYCSSLLNLGGDSMLAGTLTGVYLIKHQRIQPGSRLNRFADENILTLKKFKDYILLGTDIHGLIVWKPGAGSIQKLTTRDGLYSNSVYSIDVRGDQLWIGSVKGVNEFVAKEQGGQLVLTKINLPGVPNECSENAIVHSDSSVWLGTVRGLVVYTPNKKPIAASVPKTILEAVSFQAGEDTAAAHYNYNFGYKLPAALSVSSGGSHIAIRFQAIQFSDADNQYVYKLEGLDQRYSAPVVTNTVDYPNLPPGHYVFRVRTLMEAQNNLPPASFAFTVEPTFTQTLLFKLLLLACFLALVYGFFAYKIYAHKKDLKYIERLKFKEQELVRRQTAQDFHDDLGNKLTRINMLSELLHKNIGENRPKERLLVEQIQSSAKELYSGTKNIIWALNPENDKLGNVCANIGAFAGELFDSTSTDFEFSKAADIDNIRLSLGSSRNIILIIKELLHNTLKHAHASKVKLSVALTDSGIKFFMTDDGHGFDTGKASEGDGLKNIQNRAKNLRATLVMNSAVGRGTEVVLTIPVGPA